MKSIKVISSAERADWVVRDPDEFFAFCRWEANQLANNRTASVHEYRKRAAIALAIELRKSNRWWRRLGRLFKR